MLPAKSINEIVLEACAIDPRTAYALRGNVHAVECCATALYTSYRADDGSSVPLKLVRGKFGAGYVRVSTIGQKQDGWSVPDQAQRIARCFASKGEAFRIYVDAGLSGKLPIDDQDMIHKANASTARRYEGAYRAVFFADDRYQQDRGPMEEWLGKYVAAVAAGRESIPAEGAEDGGNVLSQNKYRPGLTCMHQAITAGLVHTIAVTDISRLSRSYALTQTLAEEFTAKKINVVGLIEALDHLINDDLGSQITSQVLAIIAEYRLRELTTGIIRGLVQKIASGQPIGVMPHWLFKDADDNAALIKEKADTIRRIARLVLDNPNLGYQRIAALLNADPATYPPIKVATHKHLRSTWAADTIRLILTNPNLIGQQSAFGRTWHVLPPIISRTEFDELQALSKARSLGANKIESRRPAHLLTGVLRCMCGNSMLHQCPQAPTLPRYRCSETTKVTGVSKSHISIQAKGAEAFFEDLCSEKPDILINQIEASASRQALLRDVDGLRQRKVEISAALDAVKAHAEETERKRAPTLGLVVTDELVRMMAASSPAVIEIRSDLTNTDKAIAEREMILRSLTPDEIAQSLRERIAHWENLTVEEKNGLIKRMIYEVRMERVDEGFIATIVPNTASRRPLAPIRSVAAKQKRGKSYSTFPTVEEWEDQVIEMTAMRIAQKNEHAREREDEARLPSLSISG